ncbi:MAG: HAMP domain-containing protein [Ardenticatenaceae bacterium]|nr:HAMP domain-containing protein [Ardenticatenaceae bacterium]
MTTNIPSNQENASYSRRTLTRIPGFGWLKKLNIGPKLSIGFAILVILTLLVIALSTLASRGAARKIGDTNDFSSPTALAAFQAEAELLRMQAGIRGYLALGDVRFRDSYDEARAGFETELAKLQLLEPRMGVANQQRLGELVDVFNLWSQWPERLFVLRGDRLEREPAYKVLAIDGVASGGQVLLGFRQLIEQQVLREPNADNLELMADMADFQVSFAAMLSGLRNYVATQNEIFRQEYESNLVLNEIAWQTLVDKGERDLLTENQLGLLATIETNRAAFLALPESDIFPILESDEVREDLYLFATEAEPRAQLMADLLEDIAEDAQTRLQDDLRTSNSELAQAREQTVVGGVVAVVLGAVLAVVLQANIVGPVRRLTRVSERIREGNLEAQAAVESGDEIGTLARTFNNMTTRLRETLFQVRKERKRANDLLNVVIPIGVQLSSEKDFNRLLEKMLIEAKVFCRADAGSLYLLQENELRFAIVHNDTLGMMAGGTSGNEVSLQPIPLYDAAGEPDLRTVAATAVIRKQTVNIDNVYHSDFDFPGTYEFDAQTSYRTQSMLTMPLLDSDEQVLGVLQLLNAADAESGEVVPFDANLQQMMESFSSLAVAALAAYMREQVLRQRIRQLEIQINEAEVQQQVQQTVESDFFKDLQGKAREIRKRRQRAREQTEE